jgi:hypothetical protein
MASTETIAKTERWIWILIYGGLFTLILGIASLSEAPGAAWTLIAIGCVATATGVTLIWVRSRMTLPADPSNAAAKKEYKQ